MKKMNMTLLVLLAVPFLAFGRGGVSGGGALPPEARHILNSIIEFRHYHGLIEGPELPNRFEFRSNVLDGVLEGDLSIDASQLDVDYLEPGATRNIKKIIFEDGSELEFIEDQSRELNFRGLN